jgi:molybdopterin converting factor small subunit
MTSKNTKTVFVELFGALRSPRGETRFPLELPAQADVRQLLSELAYDDREQKYLVILVNDRNADKRAALADGDRVKILLPIGGG